MLILTQPGKIKGSGRRQGTDDSRSIGLFSEDSGLSHSYADPGMISFQNSLETFVMENTSEPFEIKFFNKALEKIINKELVEKKDLKKVLEDQLVYSPQLERCLSLQDIAQGRFSSVILDSPHPITPYKSADLGSARSKDSQLERQVTFRKNQILFEDKTSLMLNIVDVSNKGGSFASSLERKSQELVMQGLIKTYERINFFTECLQDGRDLSSGERKQLQDTLKGTALLASLRV